MKTKRIVFISIIVAIILVIIGGYKFFNLEIIKEEYADVNERYEGFTFFTEEKGKIYPEFQYVNKNTKTVIIKNVKYAVYKSETQELVVQGKLKLNKKVLPSKKTTIRLAKIDKLPEELTNYSIDVVIE